MSYGLKITPFINEHVSVSHVPHSRCVPTAQVHQDAFSSCVKVRKIDRHQLVAGSVQTADDM